MNDMNDVASRVARFVLAVGTVLVVLGAAPTVVERDRLRWILPLDALFHSTAVGGALVLAALGHLVGSSLLASRNHGRVAAVFTALAWVVPIWMLQLVVVLAAAVVRALDGLAPNGTITGGVWGAVSAFRWNFWVAEHMLEVPRELAGLTLISIAVQLVALLAVAVVAVPPRLAAPVLGAGAAVTALAVVVLRWRAVGFQDPFLLVLDTFARSDAFFLGVVVACVASRGRRLGASWSSAAVPVLVGAVLASGFVSTDQLLRIQLPVVAVVAAVMMLDLGAATSGMVLDPVVGSREVDVVASSWAPLVALTPLAASVVGRRTEMNWILRVIVLLIVLAVALRVARTVAGRVRMPAQPVSLARLRDAWHRVVAEADNDIRTGHRRGDVGRSGGDGHRDPG